MNESAHLALEFGVRTVRLDVHYANVPGLEHRYEFDREQLGERY